MRNRSLQKTTAISLFIHTLFFMLILFTAKRQSHFTMPSAYTVNLVSIKKSLSAKKDSTIVRKALIPPKKTETKKKAKPIPAKKVKQMTTRDKTASAKVTKSLQKERTVLIEERISAIKAKKRIQRITHLRSIIDLRKKADEDEEIIIHKEQGTNALDTSEQAAVSDRTDGTIMDAYYGTIHNHIRQHWAFPDLGEENLMAIVSFKINRDGNIESIKLEESSGNAFFDRSTLNAISKAIPLPRPPFEMEVGIRFSP